MNDEGKESDTPEPLAFILILEMLNFAKSSSVINVTLTLKGQRWWLYSLSGTHFYQNATRDRRP